MKKNIIGLILLTNCGVELEQKEPLKIDVTVEHRFTLQDIEKYFTIYCRDVILDPDITSCTAREMVNFLTIIQEGTSNDQ